MAEKVEKFSRTFFLLGIPNGEAWLRMEIETDLKMIIEIKNLYLKPFTYKERLTRLTAKYRNKHHAF